MLSTPVELNFPFKKIFDWPIERGEFAAMPGWWRDTEKEGYSINGGFFKYYPKDCKYIYDKFMSDIHHWQGFYIENGTTTGPVNGEQYFVEDSVREQLDLVVLPNEWFTRWIVSGDIVSGNMNQWNYKMTQKYEQLTGNDYIYMGGEFHPDIKYVHFTNRLNKPHEWRDYENFCSN